ncbi:MAG: hypothetical protein COW75_08635 [Rhodobacterales bacterium CG18_big_fil_WC_8_21_14_2_50_71_9]|nr:MAG: hypothetical protein COW75_08635 [Rhodobacterales bacterium CG18_big_fil_WC_8_21_14_2_50_71_9]
MKTSVESFKIGMAAFVVPFMFFYSPGLLMEGEWLEIARNCATALVGVFLLSAAVQGFFFGKVGVLLRLALLAAALLMISGGLLTDAVGIALGAALYVYQTRLAARTA